MKRDYWNEFRDLEVDLCIEIGQELERIGRPVTEEDEIEFFGFSTAISSDIESFNPDGSVKFHSTGSAPMDIINVVKEGILPFYDAISILDDLQKIKE